MNDRLERFAPHLTGLAVLLLYLAFPSSIYNFDGVACAIAVELGDIKHLLHGNHLIYGFAGFLFHRALAVIGLKMGALAALQIFGALLGAGGAAMFVQLLRRRGFSTRLSIFCAIGLAVSFGYWLWSIEVQVYLLSAFFLIGALGEALEDEPRVYRLALWHSMAMLAHGANVLWTPVALYALWRSRQDPARRRTDVSRYLLASALCVLAVYMAAIVLAIEPADLRELKIWLIGTAGLTPDRSFAWHGPLNPVRGLLDWLRVGGNIVSPLRVLALPLWFAVFWGLTRGSKKDRRLAVSAALWIPVYALLYLQWEPTNLKYRLSDLIPLWLAGALLARRVCEWRWGRTVCGVFLAILFAANLGMGILPGGRPGANEDYARAMWIKKSTPPDAWIAAADVEEVYVPYFAHRRTINLRFYPTKSALGARIRNILAGGQRVFVTSTRLRTSDAFPEMLGLRAVSRQGEDALYEITSVAH